MAIFDFMKAVINMTLKTGTIICAKWDFNTFRFYHLQKVLNFTAYFSKLILWHMSTSSTTAFN